MSKEKNDGPLITRRGIMTGLTGGLVGSAACIAQKYISRAIETARVESKLHLDPEALETLHRWGVSVTYLDLGKGYEPRFIVEEEGSHLVNYNEKEEGDFKELLELKRKGELKANERERPLGDAVLMLYERKKITLEKVEADGLVQLVFTTTHKDSKMVDDILTITRLADEKGPSIFDDRSQMNLTFARAHREGKAVLIKM